MHRHLAGQAVGDLPVMGDDQHGRAGVVQFVQHFHHAGAGDRVQIAGGLVGQQQQRFPGDGPGDRDPLLLAAGELIGPVRHPVAKTDLFQCRLGTLLAFAFAQAGVEQAVGHVAERVAALSLVSEQQTRLLDSLLVLATSERGLNRTENVDLAALTGDVVRAAEPRRPGLQVVVKAAPAPVTGDPALVRRLVANLVDNAMSYNVPDGWVEVATGVDGEHCFLSVTNTGPPVPPEIVDELLNPFQRLNRTEDDGHHGLGLSIVKTIAAAHTAEMTVRARPGGGLTIRILFPAGKSARPAPRTVRLASS
jgi:signal transduction histidine kinase